MNRAYYKNSISQFIAEDKNSILGQLSLNHSNRQLEDLQKNAWVKQIEILKDQLTDIEGQIYFEFAIPRMGKRVDNVIIIKDSIFVINFFDKGLTNDPKVSSTLPCLLIKIL